MGSRPRGSDVNSGWIHFKPHRDSEKADGMFATMVICISSEHEGGDVVVRLGQEAKKYSTAMHSEWKCSYLAWYADVLHEVRPVETGARVVLTYNLIYNGQEQIPNPTKATAQLTPWAFENASNIERGLSYVADDHSRIMVTSS